MEHQSDLIQVDESKMSRRSFLRISMTTLGALAALEIGSASLLYLQANSLEGNTAVSSPPERWRIFRPAL